MKKKETWKFILQTLLSVLSAIATAFGVASCIGSPSAWPAASADAARPPSPPRAGTGRTGVFFAPFAILFLRETRIFAAP